MSYAPASYERDRGEAEAINAYLVAGYRFITRAEYNQALRDHADGFPVKVTAYSHGPETEIVYFSYPTGAISDSDRLGKLNSMPENTAKYPDSAETSDSDAPWAVCDQPCSRVGADPEDCIRNGCAWFRK